MRGWPAAPIGVLSGEERASLGRCEVPLPCAPVWLVLLCLLHNPEAPHQASRPATMDQVLRDISFSPRRRAGPGGGGVAGCGCGARGSGRGRAVERGRWSGGDGRRGTPGAPARPAPAGARLSLKNSRLNESRTVGRRLATLHVARGPFICDARSAPSPPRAPTPWYLVALSSYKVCMWEWDSGGTLQHMVI